MCPTAPEQGDGRRAHTQRPTRNQIATRNESTEMVETTTSGLQFAHRMQGIPRSTGGHLMPEALWFELAPPVPVADGVAPYIAVGKYGVYECDSHGHADFRRRVYNFPIGATLEQALAGVGDGYVGL